MPPFTNEAIDIEQLPKYETLSLSQPHPSYWKIILINISICCLFIAGTIVLLLINIPELRVYAKLIGVGFLMFVGLLFILYRTSFKKRGYALRERDIVFKSGIIAESTTIVPLNRIQHVSLDEGVFSRMFKLARLQIYTAGGGSGHLVISGIEVDRAKSIKEALLNRLATIHQETGQE